MRIMLLNQAPRTPTRGPGYDVEPIEKLVNSYASPGTRIEIGFPENFAGAEVFHTLGVQRGEELGDGATAPGYTARERRTRTLTRPRGTRIEQEN